jgi:hypothetical protein
MIRKILLVTVSLLAMSGVCAADSVNLQLSAGSHSVTGDISAKRYIPSGFLKYGAGFVYTHDDGTEYKFAALHLTAGSETLAPGLTCDFGLRALGGRAEDDSHSGDLGVIGFTGNVNYLFPREILPVPLEVFGSLTWGPSVLCVEDADGYLEWTLGTGIRIVQNVSIVGTYTKYRMDMESGPGDWRLNDDVLRLGMVLSF